MTANIRPVISLSCHVLTAAQDAAWLHRPPPGPFFKEITERFSRRVPLQPGGSSAELRLLLKCCRLWRAERPPGAAGIKMEAWFLSHSRSAAQQRREATEAFVRGVTSPSRERLQRAPQWGLITASDQHLYDCAPRKRERRRTEGSPSPPSLQTSGENNYGGTESNTDVGGATNHHRHTNQSCVDSS